MTDTELLDWLADNDIIEGFAGVADDIHDINCAIAGDGPITKAVKREALRELIARAAAPAPAPAGEKE